MLTDAEYLDAIDWLTIKGLFWKVQETMSKGFSIRISLEIYFNKYPKTYEAIFCKSYSKE